jgi:hypothetical protein
MMYVEDDGDDGNGRESDRDGDSDGGGDGNGDCGGNGNDAAPPLMAMMSMKKMAAFRG